MWMFVFLLLPLAAVAYISWHVWVLLPLTALWKSVVIIVGVLCFLTLFLDLGRRLDTMPLPVAQVLYKIGTSSVIVMLYMTLLFLVLDLGRLVHIVPQPLLHDSWPMTVAIAIGLSGVLLYGNIHYYNKVRVPLTLTTDKPLPHDYRVVMASDLHLGYHNPRHELARWVDMINAEHPDFILIAGDIVDISVRPLIEEGMAQEFRRLTAPVYACLGNHEYYSGAPEAQRFYRDADIHLLVDSHAVIDSSLLIIGRDDRTNLRRKSLAELVKPLTPHPSPFTILLDHQPYDLNLTEEAGIDFQLSGHTHRGQVWPISWITDAIYECSWGSHQRGNTRYYVSSGIGIWGGKFRIGTQSEYIVATIRQATLNN